MSDRTLRGLDRVRAAEFVNQLAATIGVRARGRRRRDAIALVFRQLRAAPAELLNCRGQDAVVARLAELLARLTIATTLVLADRTRG